MEKWKSCSKPPTSSEWFFSQWFWGFAIGSIFFGCEKDGFLSERRP
jgi:hypothetical protein